MTTPDATPNQRLADEIEFGRAMFGGLQLLGWLNPRLDSIVAALRARPSDTSSATVPGVTPRFSQIWSARILADGVLDPGMPISGTCVSYNPVDTAALRHNAEHFTRIKPGEPFFYVDAPFVLCTPTPAVTQPEPNLDREMRGGEPCAWPECGCDHDASCADAIPLMRATAQPEPEARRPTAYEISVARLMKQEPEPEAAPIREGVERHMDEIDAGQAGEAWLERSIERTPMQPGSCVECYKIGADGKATVFWHQRKPRAAYLLLRDEANFTVLLRWQSDPPPAPSGASVEAVARAIYAEAPNGGEVPVPTTDTVGWRKEFRADTWEEAPDRHEVCLRQARAVLALAPQADVEQIRRELRDARYDVEHYRKGANDECARAETAEARLADVMRLANAWRDARQTAWAAPLGDPSVWVALGDAETSLSSFLALRDQSEPATDAGRLPTAQE